MNPLNILQTNLENFIEKLPSTAKIRMFGITKVPLIFLVAPKVLQLDDTACKVRIPLNYLTRNHLGSMYFGTLAIGADSVAGIFALHFAALEKGKKVVPVFKNFKADFLKRPEGPVIFVCEAGAQIQDMVKRAAASGERVTENISIVAFVEGDDKTPVAKFELGLSLKAI